MTKRQSAEEKKIDDNIVYIGNKPPMSYVPVVVAILNAEASHEVILKARGNAISRAVDTAEIVRNRFCTEAELKGIKIGTEPVTNEDGRTSNVSSIELSLSLPK